MVEDVLEGDEGEGLDSDEFEGLNAPKLDSQEPVTGVSKEKLNGNLSHYFPN